MPQLACLLQPDMLQSCSKCCNLLSVYALHSAATAIEMAGPGLPCLTGPALLLLCGMNVGHACAFMLHQTAGRVAVCIALHTPYYVTGRLQLHCHLPHQRSRFMTYMTSYKILGQADSFALQVRSLLLPGVQDPSNQCLLHHTSGRLLWYYSVSDWHLDTSSL
jgi:hypothetical protein